VHLKCQTNIQAMEAITQKRIQGVEAAAEARIRVVEAVVEERTYKANKAEAAAKERIQAANQAVQEAEANAESQIQAANLRLHARIEEVVTELLAFLPGRPVRPVLPVLPIFPKNRFRVIGGNPKYMNLTGTRRHGWLKVDMPDGTQETLCLGLQIQHADMIKDAGEGHG
jgi:multidrug resistance efflux pump